MGSHNLEDRQARVREIVVGLTNEQIREDLKALSRMEIRDMIDQRYYDLWYPILAAERDARDE